jgi:hypothetical protein
MRSTKLAVFAILLSAFAAPAHADTDLGKVAERALKGEEVKNVQVGRHGFHVKPVTVVRSDKGKIVTGQISHDITARPDDQVKYRVVIKEGADAKFEISIARGGVEQFLPIPKEMKGKGGKIIDGDWEPSCQQIIDVIAAKVELE